MNRTKLFITLASLCLSFGVLKGTEPLNWTLSTAEEFLEGDLRGVSVTSDGRLVLAPTLNAVVDTDEAFIYSGTLDRSGTVYVGTGTNGRIFRVTASGQASSWAQVEEAGVHALAVDASNRLYAGTGPEGKVYRFNDRGDPQVFFNPEEKYIWALAVDRQSNLFVATGPQGIIYKVTPQGSGSVFYDSKETHIVSLSWDLSGNLLAGTAPNGLLFRLTPAGIPYVVYDSALEEIRAITVDRYGNTYAAALAEQPRSSSENAGASGTNSSQQEPETSGGETATVKVSDAPRGQRLEIYRIDKQNLIETLYTSNDELAFDLLIRSNGDLLVGTGKRGRILSIDPRKFVTLLVQTPEQQVTKLLERDGNIFAATSNLGKVVQLLPRPSEAGVYQSKVLDSQMISSWGVIRWRSTASGPAVKVYTRSGNTADPDQTWNDWSGPYTESKGSRIQSPVARFLQWKIEFPKDGGATALADDRSGVEQVNVTYMQHNMAPQITSLTVHPPGLAFLPHVGNAGGAASPGGPDQAHLRSLPRSIRSLGAIIPKAPPRKVYVAGSRSITWNATDPNGDYLLYAIYYRSQEESTWKLLKKDLLETHYTIDGLSFPDGAYVIKVAASDHPSNPADRALESELISKSFVIANTSPQVDLQSPRVQGKSVSLRFTARTSESVVHQAEYSANGGQWRIVFPQDGIADSDSETYDLSIDGLDSGDHVITVRVIDSVGNIGTGKVTAAIP